MTGPQFSAQAVLSASAAMRRYVAVRSATHSGMFIQSRTLQGPRTSNAKAKRRKPGRSMNGQRLTQTLARMLHTSTESTP